MLEKLKTIREDTLERLKTADSVEALRQLEAATVGKKGEITQALRTIGQLPSEERPAVGQLANEVRQELEAAIAARAEVLNAQEMAQHLEAGRVDMTLPGRRQPVGRLHPATQTLRTIYAIWAEMGFQVYPQPRRGGRRNELHAAQHATASPRTRYVGHLPHRPRPGMILRTHTSPGQIHAMRAFAPEPIRVILPGMCYRYEQITPRSEIQFNQVEGLAVGHNIPLTDLKGTMAAFARRMYGADRKVRFRCSHFPFTEPSMEIDVECILCDGEGCTCANTPAGWRSPGRGMVHPVVLANGGYDPARVLRLRLRHGAGARHDAAATASRTSGCSGATTCAS